MTDCPHGKPTAGQIIQARLSFLRNQRFMVKTRCFTVDFQHTRPQTRHAVVYMLFGHLKPCTLRQKPNRFHIIQIFYFPHKGDNIPACPTAKTVKRAIIGINVKGGSLLVMKRAQSHQIATTPAQVYIGGYQLRNVCPGLQLLQK